MPALASPSEDVLAAIAQALAGVTDPEIPVISLSELGVLRQVRLGTDGVPEVVITPTYSGCPAMEQMESDLRAALTAAGLHARIVTQLAPAWSTDWMSPAAREKLRAWGIAPPVARPVEPGSATANSGAVIQLVRPRAPRTTVACPQCGSGDTTEISHFGSTACKALYRCLACLEPFDYFKPC